MRIILICTCMIAVAAFASPASAQSDACKVCRDQQKACMSNYAGKTCKIEYDMCMKSCTKKK
jgi:hypothetical protein